MAGENIRLNTNQINFAATHGYFFIFDHVQDSLLQKTDDGNTAFSYPVDVLLTNAVKDVQFDGVYFWSEENPGGGIVYIKKWKIENYICKLQQTITLSSGVIPGNLFNSETFSLAHYHTSLRDPVNSGSNTIYLNDYWNDDALMGFTTTSGDGLTLHLGPNNNAEEEDVVVSGVVSSGVVLITPLNYSYESLDEVNFFTHLWLFNNYNGLDSSTGALYKLDAYTGGYITKYASGTYKDIYASTFYNVNSFADYGSVNTLAYIKGTNTLFIDVGTEGDVLSHYGSMVMDNVSSDSFTVINIYALTMDDQNVYRLQLRQDGAGGDWATYNYELSSLDSFITSISLVANPAIIAANAISTSTIIAIVKDQFLQPVAGRTVTFSETATPGGGLSPNPVNTDSEGQVVTIFTSGTAAQEVTITAVASQV